MRPTTYGRITTWGTQPWEKCDNNGKGWPSDFMMIILWVINVSSRSPKLEWASLTHTSPHIANEISRVIERTNYILETPSPEYTQQPLTDVSKTFYHMCSMQVRKSPWWSSWKEVACLNQSMTSRPLYILSMAHILDCALSKEILLVVVSFPNKTKYISR